MSNVVIRAEGLAKSYRIRHQSPERYRALRDVISDNVRAVFNRGGHWTEGRSTVEDFWALKDVSFEIERGEVVGIIGRNGAGKSTLLKILSRITEPSKGRITLSGNVASLLEVGTGFHPELTGRENIFLNGAILGMARAEIRRKFDEIVAFAEVERFLDTPVKRYSSGMYVRLAFAVAAHLEPEILVVDEVLAVGDAAFQKKCIGKMQDVSHGQGRTILFVSHNMAAVSALCSRAIVLESGMTTYDGDVSEAISRYNSSIPSVSRRHLENTPHIRSVTVSQSELMQGTLAVDVEFASPWPLNPLLVGAVVHGTQGNPIFGFNSLMDPEFDQSPVQNGVATLRVPQVPLHPGLYRIDVWLGEKDQNHDHLPDAAAFEFASAPSLPHGVSSDVAGSTRVAGRWTIGPVRPETVVDRQARRP